MSTIDPWVRFASVVADGVGIDEGSRVSVTLTDVDAFVAAEAVVTEIHARGAIPHVTLADERFDRAALRLAPPERLAVASEPQADAMRWSDVHIALRGMVPPDPTRPAIDNERFAALKSAQGQISTLRWGHTRWCVARVPTASWAEMIEMSHEDLVDEFFAGCLIDWPTARARWQHIADRLNEASTVRIVGAETDLVLPVEGRRWVVFGGQFNLPDGELATAPIEDGVEGYITFEDPFVFAGRHFERLRLDFEHGSVTAVDCGDNGLARALIDTDAGSRRVGELGIGVNGKMTALTRDLFFDEKVLGTVHIALGRAYPECRGANKSTLHWDLVKDLRPRDGRPGGQLLVDGDPLDLAALDSA